MTHQTKHRLLYSYFELRTCYGITEDKFPDCMELLPNGDDVAIYLTEEQFQERQGDLFPRCPITGAFCRWDSDWELMKDLY